MHGRRSPCWPVGAVGVALLRIVGVTVGLTVGATVAQAQGAGGQTTAPTRPVAKDSVRSPATAPIARVRIPARMNPPLTPARAFAYSALVPGLGQSRLDRGISGALFASIELAAFAMVRQSAADLREVRRYRIDTLPSDFTVSGSTLSKTGTFTNKFTADLERARKLHVEDWLAVIAFNHLFAGADAFVSAQLWDVPVSMSVLPSRTGAVATLSVRW